MILFKNSFSMILKHWFSPVDTINQAELIELVEIDVSLWQSIKAMLYCIFFPVLKFNFTLMLNELEEFVIT